MIRLTRFLKPPQIKLELESRTPEVRPEGGSEERSIWSMKEQVLGEIAGLLDASGKIVNRSKLLTDLLNRERKATTGIGQGVAIPHVRTMQAREFALCFARSTPGVEFGAIDGRPVHFILGLVAPPYDDRLYQQLYPTIGEIFTRDATREALLNAQTAHEVIRVFSSFGG